MPDQTEMNTPSIDLSKYDNSDYPADRSPVRWLLWYFVGSPIVETPWIPVSSLKVAVLRLFGAKIGEGVYVKPRVRVKFPWLLTVGNHCWIGEDVWIDNLAAVTIGSSVCISQAAYLCTGNHDWTTPNMKIFARSIKLEDGSWVGARSTLCPGVKLGAGSIAAVGSVVQRDIPDFEIWSGNPATFVKKRQIRATAH
jgi:putative colanic acid biosynthesis acetyltransferase WcaF